MSRKVKTSVESSSPTQNKKFKIQLSTSEDTDDDDSIPETPEYPCSTSPALDNQSLVDLIENYTPPPATRECTSQLEEIELIHQIESCSSSSSSAEFNVTSLIESPPESEPPSPTSRPNDAGSSNSLSNGMAADLKQLLIEHRSRESTWSHNYKTTNIGKSNNSAELVHVKLIKKFHSHCLLVEVLREEGHGDGECESLVLNPDWNAEFSRLQAGDTLIVNFLGKEPIQLNGKQMHFLPYVRRLQ